MDRDVRVTRVDMVRERIYRNHQQTRFFNHQEQVKLKLAIAQLEKLEKDRWSELCHRVNELEVKVKTISVYADETQQQSKKKRRKKRRPIIARKDARKASVSFLLSPYQADELEYQHVLGYAQHMTKKKARKSSSVNADIELDDLDEYQYKQPRQRTRSQQLILYGLQQTARDLGLYQERKKRKNKTVRSPPKDDSSIDSRRQSFMSDTLSTYNDPPRSALKSGRSKGSGSRRVSFLPTPTLYLDDESHLYGGPNVHSFNNESVLPDIKNSYLSVRPPPLKLPAIPNNEKKHKKRRQSRAAGEISNHLSVGSSEQLSRLYGLKPEFTNKMDTFNKKLAEFKEREIQSRKRRGSVLDEHGMHLVTPADPSKAITTPVVVLDEGRETPGITLYGLKKWRKVKAIADSITAIRNCSYIRNPSRDSIPTLKNQLEQPERETNSPELPHGFHPPFTSSPARNSSLLPKLKVALPPILKITESTPASKGDGQDMLQLDQSTDLAPDFEREEHRLKFYFPKDPFDAEKIYFPDVVEEVIKNKVRLSNKTSITHITTPT